MTPYEIREKAFKHLVEVGRDTAVRLAALLAVPVRDLIRALDGAEDFTRVAGEGCWDWAAHSLSVSALDAQRKAAADRAAMASQRAFAETLKGARRSDVYTPSAAILADLRTSGPGTVKQIAERLGWSLSRTWYQLHRCVDLISQRRTGPGVRSPILYSLRDVVAA